jgi:hypothetical protein
MVTSNTCVARRGGGAGMSVGSFNDAHYAQRETWGKLRASLV